MGINPTPTVTECCNHFDNPLIAKVLHTSAVGAGFIPALPTADKIHGKYPAAARVGINPTPTLDVCCKRFIINVLHANYDDCNSFYFYEHGLALVAVADELHEAIEGAAAVGDTADLAIFFSRI